LLTLSKGALPHIRRLSDDETLTYLHSTISTKYHRVKGPDTPMYLDAVVPDEPLTPGLEPKLGDSFLKVICLRSFPGTSFPVLFDGLNNLHLLYRWTSRFICLDKESAIRELKKYKRQWYAKRKTLETLIKDVFSKDSDRESIMTDTDATNKAHDSDLALQEVSDDRVAYGFYTFTVIVSDRDKAKAEEKIKAIERIINGLGFTTIREGVNAVEAWLGSLPGHVHANVRRPLISTLNLAHMMPISALWAGEEMNSHLNGPPLFLAISSGNTPFRFTHHIGDVGHTLVVGPTGAGKSVLLSLMALQFLRYRDAQVYFFDKGASALPATAGAGGDFYDLGSDKGGLAFQPLAAIDSNAELSWAFEWVIDLLILENVGITPGLKKELWSSLTSLATAPKEQRTITGLIALVQNRLIREALTPYSLRGTHGRLLDSTHDGLTDCRWQCFEMEEIMNTPRIVPPVLMYLFHCLEGRFKESHPSLLILDEAWLFLDNPFFSERIKEWLKVLRKKNVSVIFATQSLSDIVSSPLFTTVVESCPTRIFLPNSSALDETTKPLYQTFGLNQRQIEILATATPRRDYYYSSPKGNRLFQLGLGPCALSFCSASSEEKREIRYLLRTGKAVLGVGDIVFDPTNYVENVIQAYNTAEQLAQEAEQIAHQITQITNQVKQIENQARNLAHLDYSSLDDMTYALNKLDGVINQAEGLGFHLSQMNDQFDELYPEIGNSPESAQIYSQKYTTWLEQTRSSINNALLAQGLVENNSEDRDRLTRLIDESQGAGGNLQVLQASNQISALLVQKTMELQTIVAANGQAAASRFAQETAAEDYSRAWNEKFFLKEFKIKKNNGSKGLLLLE